MIWKEFPKAPYQANALQTGKTRMNELGRHIGLPLQIYKKPE